MMHFNTNLDTEQYNEEKAIFERCLTSSRPPFLPEHVSLVDEHVYRDLFGNVIVVQIYIDPMWNELRERNVKNCEIATCIDTLYRGKSLEQVQKYIVDAIKKDLTV